MRPFVGRVQYVWELVMVVSVAMGLVLGEWLGVMAPIRSLVQRVSQPIVGQSARVYFALATPVRNVNARYETAVRVEQLEAELNKTAARLSELERVEEENTQLRQSIGAQERPERTIIGSPIVSYGMPTISVGSVHGVQSGSPVLAFGLVVGVVDDVSDRQSTVSLLFQQHVQPLVVRTESGVEGLILGDGKRVLLTEVSHDQTLVPGERIVTAGQEHVLPDLLIGTVQERISDQASPVQTATVEQSTSFYEVSIVEVLP